MVKRLSLLPSEIISGLHLYDDCAAVVLLFEARKASLFARVLAIVKFCRRGDGRGWD